MQEIVKCYYTNIVFIGQLCVKFFQCCIGMIGDELTYLFFVGSQFEFRSTFVRFGGDAACFAAFFS